MGRVNFDHVIAGCSGLERTLAELLNHIVNLILGDRSGLAIGRPIAEELLNIRSGHALVNGLAADMPELNGCFCAMGMYGVNQIAMSGKVAIISDIQ
jgi:hypothetical protein